MQNKEIESQDFYMRARALFSANKYNEAEKYFERAIEANPMNVDAHMGLVHLYIDLKQYTKAKDCLKKILVIDGKNGEVYFHLGNICYFNKDMVGARTNYSKAISFGFDNPVALYYMALSNYATKDYVNAKFYLNEILQKDKTNPKARIKLIEMAMSEMNYEEMLIQADELILNRPDAFEGYHYKFLALIETNKDDEAANVLAHAIKLFPGDMGFAYDLVFYYQKTKQYEDALKFIEKRFSKNEETKNMIALEKEKILFKLERFDEALEVVENTPTEYIDVEGQFLAITMYMQKEKYTEAIRVADEISEKKIPNAYTNASIFVKGMCYEKMGKVENAKETISLANLALTQDSIKNPGNITLYIYRALCEIYLKEYEKALELTDYAISLTDSNGDLYYVRGLIYEKLDDTDNSIKDYEKAKELNSTLMKLNMEV